MSPRKSIEPVHRRRTKRERATSRRKTSFKDWRVSYDKDHVSVVVNDLPAAIAFFITLGMELEGEMPVEGPWVDRLCGLERVQVDIAMMRAPDGDRRVVLTKFRHREMVVAEPASAPPNTLGLRQIMFAVEDIDGQTGVRLALLQVDGRSIRDCNFASLTPDSPGPTATLAPRFPGPDCGTKSDPIINAWPLASNDPDIVTV